MPPRSERRPGGRWRERIILDLVKILGAGKPTIFAFEGPCRHGLRSTFCLSGKPWSESDALAAAIVAEALRRLGAVRPAWWQGQPEYADTDTSRGWCERRDCGRPIPVDRGSTNGYSVKYCSEFCQGLEHARRQRQHGAQQSMAEYLAGCAARSEQTLQARARDCAQCGKSFLTREIDRKYCSRRCYALACTVHPERLCAHCAKPFKPKNSGPGHAPGQYCSRECSAAARIKARPARQCPTCEMIFRPRFPSDRKRFCSHDCADVARRGNGPPAAEPFSTGEIPQSDLPSIEGRWATEPSANLQKVGADQDANLHLESPSDREGFTPPIGEKSANLQAS